MIYLLVELFSSGLWQTFSGLGDYYQTVNTRFKTVSYSLDHFLHKCIFLLGKVYVILIKISFIFIITIEDKSTASEVRPPAPSSDTK